MFIALIVIAIWTWIVTSTLIELMFYNEMQVIINSTVTLPTAHNSICLCMLRIVSFNLCWTNPQFAPIYIVTNMTIPPHYYSVIRIDGRQSVRIRLVWLIYSVVFSRADIIITHKYKAEYRSVSSEFRLCACALNWCWWHYTWWSPIT